MNEPGHNGGVGNAHGEASEEQSPGAAFRDAAAQVGELKAYASQYVSARLDAMKVSARRAVVWAVLGVVGLLVAVSVIVTAAVLVVAGLGQAISALLGGHAWAGNLIAGAGVLGVIALVAWLIIRRMFKASLKATMDRYERRLQRQRIEHGHDARQRSSEYGTGSD